jgi:hypothetical protein
MLLSLWVILSIVLLGIFLIFLRPYATDIGADRVKRHLTQIDGLAVNTDKNVVLPRFEYLAIVAGTFFNGVVIAKKGLLNLGWYSLTIPLWLVATALPLRSQNRRASR